ncbi:MAG TPA: FUSC family protein [Roseiarcus sp.]|jgi:uncharacterized membrane protein YccC
MLTWPSPRALLTAFSVYVAVILALYVAFALDLPNPWWAMATAYIAQPRQPLIGAIWAKAFYRVAGTIIGAIASIALIPNLANSPELMILAVAGWVGLCVFGGLLDRSPRFYLFMLAGYTVTLVGLPAAAHPDAIFDIAVARSEEILLGVIASALVQSVLFPRSVATAMTARLDEVMADTRTWISQMLCAAAPVPAPHHLANQLTEINLMATDWRFEATAFSGSQRRALWALEERLIALLPLITAVEDRIAALRDAGVAPPNLPAVTSRVASWFGTAKGADARANDPVLEEIGAAAPELGPASSWADLLAASLAGRLTELVETWRECVLLAAAVRDPTGRTRKAAIHLVAGARPRSLHVDKGVALHSAIVAALTIIGAAAFSIAIRWQSGPVAIAIAAMCCALFSTADDPIPQVRDFFIGLLIALPLPLLYEFAILPQVDDFVMLAVVLFPVMIVLGVLLTYPGLSLMALGAVVTFAAGLALQPSFAADLPSLMNGYLGLVIGPIFALVGLSLARVLPAHRVMRRILRSGWRDLAALTRAQRAPDRTVWTSRMLDRIGLLLPRLSQIGASEEGQLSKALRDLRLGVGIVELKRLRTTVDADTRREVDAMFAELAKHFDALSRGKPAAVSTGVVARLDAAMAAILELPDPVDRDAAIGAAIGFRRNLFPHAPAYRAISVTQ